MEMSLGNSWKNEGRNEKLSQPLIVVFAHKGCAVKALRKINIRLVLKSVVFNEVADLHSFPRAPRIFAYDSTVPSCLPPTQGIWDAMAHPQMKMYDRYIALQKSSGCGAKIDYERTTV